MKNKALAIILCIFIMIIFLFPLFRDMNCYIPGTADTNETYGYLWFFWFYQQEPLLGNKAMYLTAHPYGIDFSKLFHYPVYTFINKAAVKFMSGVLYFNVNVLVSFLLTFIATFLLISWMVENSLASFFGAIAFTFCPYRFARIWQQMGLAHLEFYCLAVFSLVCLFKNLGKRAFLLFMISSFLVFSFDLYYGYMFVVSAALFLVYYLFKVKERGVRPRFLIGMIISGLCMTVLLLPEILLLMKGFSVISKSAEWKTIYVRPFHDLFIQSAKPLSYLLPATVHPIFGKFTERFIGSPLYGISYTEHTLYLGWTTLILAFAAFRRWRRNKSSKFYVLDSRLDEKEKFYIGFFIWLAIVAWLFSQPPYFTFPYFKIYMPSFLMYKILPMFRAYSRFGIVVMLAVSVLASFGLKFILEKFKGSRVKTTFATLMCGVVLFEFLNFPPFKVIDLTKYPKVYDWLKRERGDFAIAEYPLDVESPNEYYKFCQTIHEKKIINGTIPGTYANKVVRAIWRLSDPLTPQVLSWMKVKYVLVHLSAYEGSTDMEFLDELEKIKMRKIPGLEFDKTFDDVQVYEVVAGPLKPNVE